ncbi:MAG: T9SS type A sorting domain-containing protein, partial [Bacteroidia bacterium]|nr:T9SS type A sorting domain-containing protein [Bacteroidia bacterium]
SSFTANNIGISNTSTMYSSYITNDTLMVGNTYIIHTKINGGDGSVGAWIDYNQNNVFDSTEFIPIVSQHFNAGVFTIGFTIPITATVGATLMRIRTSKFFEGLTATQACTALTYGEAEDYTINIAAHTSYCVPPTPHNIGGGQIDTVIVKGLNYLNSAPGITSNFDTAYSYFPTSMGNLQLGNSDTLKVFINGSNSGFGAIAFIDWNNDFFFDISESINYSNIIYSPINYQLHFIINVPSNALLGLKRLRIRTSYGNTTDPCNASIGGETEDYVINIVAPTSIAKQINTVNIKAYPNPTTGILTIALPTNEVASYQVFNSIGQLVINGIFIDNKIDLSAHKNGTYTLRVITSNGVSTQRVVVQH